MGLFQDLQNVNPFDETFKKAAELAKNGCLHVPEICADDTLHTPHILPHITEESSKKYTINRVPSLDEDLLKIGNKETDCDNVVNKNAQNSPGSINKSHETGILNKSTYKTQEMCSDNFNIPSIDEQLLIIDSRQSDSDDDLIVIDECIHINTKTSLNEAQKVSSTSTSSNFLTTNSNEQAPETIKTATNYVNKVCVKEVLKNKVKSLSQKPKSVRNEQVTIKKPVLTESSKSVALIMMNKLLPQAPRKQIIKNLISESKIAKKVTEKNEHITAEKQKVREINRVAQLRSRARKKLWINDMQMNIEKLKAENKLLLTENQMLKNEVFAVKSVLLYHKDCEISKDPLASK